MIRILSEILVMLGASPAISLVAKGTVVLALGLISAWFARRSRAAVRHALLASTFGVLLALPIVSVVATPVPIAVPVAKGDSNISPLFDYISVPSSGEPVAKYFSAPAAKSGWALTPLSTMLLCGWFLGTAFFVLPIIRGLLQIRSLRRFGLPWRHGHVVAEGLAPGIRRQVDVLLHESLPGPMTCGVLNPVIILPADAQSWDKQDLERALVHELEHVRRYDWATHCLARVACAAYWFHPLVWAAWRRLTLEAEQSCDDAVLRRSEAAAYADQLVGLARRRSVLRKSPALAMANRSDLSSRVGAMLDSRQQRGRAGAFLVAVACTVATAVVVTMSPLRMVAAPQSSSDRTTAIQPTFEVASVKPAIPGQTGGNAQFLPGGRFTATNVPLDYLIERIYEVRSFQLVGAPNWMAIIADGYSARYEIQAKGDESATEAQVKEMVKTLLADRFRLKVHKETRTLPVYALIPARTGIKLAVAKDNAKPRSNGIMSMAPGWIQGANVSIPSFIQGLSRYVDRPVVDKTNFADGFDFRLTWTPDSGAAPDPETVLAGSCPSTFALLQERLGPGPAPTSCPSIFTAVQEQLGLKLDAQSDPVEVLVIDHVERPSPN